MQKQITEIPENKEIVILVARSCWIVSPLGHPVNKTVFKYCHYSTEFQ